MQAPSWLRTKDAVSLTPDGYHLARTPFFEPSDLSQQASLTRLYQPHHNLIKLPRVQLCGRHKELQINAQGFMRLEGDARVILIRIVDVVVSRHKIKSYSCLETANLGLPNFQLTLH